MATPIHAEFRTEPAKVRAGQPATLIFAVKDDQGTRVRDLQDVHEKAMHLIVVSEDLNEFEHLHPEQTEDSGFRVTHTFQHGGHYKLYADFTPSHAEPVVDKFNLAVSGNARPAVALVEDMGGIRTVQRDGLNVTMTSEKPLRAGEETILNFAVADARTNEPVIDLQPYLGTLAHFVIISQDGTDFLHAHPIQKSETPAPHGHHGHGDHEAKSHMHGMSMASTSEVGAYTSFPRAGFYKVWAQFQRGGRVITVPFVVRVGEVGQDIKNVRQVAMYESSNRLALSATIHCLTGCSIGEVLGMVIGTALGLNNAPTIVISIVLAFLFGYALTMLPLLRARVTFRTALGLALASDTASIAIMEIVDNGIMLVIPGAMNAGLGEFKFWGSLALSLLIAGAAAFPVVRWLIARGSGHAVVHKYHDREGSSHGDHH